MGLFAGGCRLQRATLRHSFIVVCTSLIYKCVNRVRVIRPTTATASFVRSSTCEENISTCCNVIISINWIWNEFISSSISSESKVLMIRAYICLHFFPCHVVVQCLICPSTNNMLRLFDITKEKNVEDVEMEEEEKKKKKKISVFTKFWSKWINIAITSLMNIGSIFLPRDWSRHVFFTFFPSFRYYVGSLKLFQFHIKYRKICYY